MRVLGPELDAVARSLPMRVVGRIAALRGLTAYADDVPLPVGSLVAIGRERTLGEIVGFDRKQAIVMTLGQTTGIRPGDPVEGIQTDQTAPVGPRMLGRVVDGIGRPIDGRGPIGECVRMPINPEPLGPMQRRPIDRPLRTGIRAIDLMTPVGQGQRLGIFAGPGVGKSTLMGQIAQNTNADVNVIALIGERGREVREFLQDALGQEGLSRSVIVVATGDESPLLRIRAAKLACTAAEYFRDRGAAVMLMMDSVTRFAHAQRQVGLSVGEPPATKGYTPSVFAQLALLLERAGAVDADAEGAGGGSITGLYAILVEGDDTTEPISDAARGILDGHVMLSRRLAQRGHYPAIDVLDSVSRVGDQVSESGQIAARRQVARLLAKYGEIEDLVQIGAYAAGASPEADVAIEYEPRINDLLRQAAGERYDFAEAHDLLVRLAIESGEAIQKRARPSGARQPNPPRPGA